MTSPTFASVPSRSDDPRPPIFKLGVGLLVIHDLIVIGLCAFGGVLGAFGILFGSIRMPESGGIGVMLLFGSLIALFLMLGVGLACLSLAVCFMAWSGTRVWLQALIGVALLNCVVVLPNPIGILAGVLCVLGSLQYMENMECEPASESTDTASSLDSTTDPDPED